MSNDPRVSVCIPSFNHAPYLPDAIESVLRQTYRDFEIVLVDDGSTDGSLEIAARYAESYPSHVRIFTHPGQVNLGISETVNLAYRKSRGEFWSGLPSDDMLLPDKLERQVAFLDANPNVGWVYSYAELVEQADQPPAELKLLGADITKDDHPLRHLIQKNSIFGMTAMMRRSCTEKVGLHETSLIYSDWEFWLRLIAQCQVAFLAHPVARYRVHSYNTSVHVEPHENMRRALEVMLSFYPKAESLGMAQTDPRTLALIDLQSCFYFFCLRQEAEATLCMQSAFQIDPTLAQDEKFFTRWLRARIFELTYTFPPLSRERGFASWVRTNLPSAAEKTLADRAAAADMAQAALEMRETNLRASRRLSLSCLRHDPSWLSDGNFRYVLLESLFGQRLMKKLRQLRLSLEKKVVR